MKRLVVYRKILDDNRVLLLLELTSGFRSDDFMEIYFKLCSLVVNNEDLSFAGQIINLAAYDENPFTLAAEKGEEVSQNLKNAVIHDITVLKELCMSDFKKLAKEAGDTSFLLDGKSDGPLTEFFQKNKPDDIFSYLYELHSKKGSGIFYKHAAFAADENLAIKPVTDVSPTQLEDLYGYERQKKDLLKNTERLVKGLPSQNILLHGDSGTGKSTMVKAMLPVFSSRKLRLIEVDKDKLHALHALMADLSERGLCFIIFIDDLSFEHDDEEYKFLKTIIQGGLYENMRNIRFYVTSNRRNIVKQDMEARANEVNVNDFLNETISLTDRFGLKIYFESPTKEEYKNMVRYIASRESVDADDDMIEAAVRFAFYNGGYNGRSARQFIDGMKD